MNYLRVVGVIGLLVASIGCTTQVDTSTVAPVLSIPDDPIAYISNDQVWLANADGTEPSQLTYTEDAHSSPVWFANKEQLAYVTESDQYYQLWRHALGEEPEFILATKRKPKHLAVAPNNQNLVYIEEADLYMVDLETNKRSRLHEGVVSASWSFDGKQLLIATDDERVLLQTFTVDGELDTPTVLLEEAAVSPIFIDAHTIAYEGIWEEQATVITLDLIELEREPMTSLRFDEIEPSTRLQLKPLGQYMLYQRIDDVTQLPNAWIFHIDKDDPKLILTNVYTVSWSDEDNQIYYVESELINDELIPSIYSATDNGLNKTEIISNAHSIVSPAIYTSNEYIDR